MGGAVRSSLLGYDPERIALVLTPLAGGGAGTGTGEGWWDSGWVQWLTRLAPYTPGSSLGRPSPTSPSHQSVLLTDISDIRPGTHSRGFVLTDSTDKHAQVTYMCVCLYGCMCGFF